MALLLVFAQSGTASPTEPNLLGLELSRMLRPRVQKRTSPPVATLYSKPRSGWLRAETTQLNSRLALSRLGHEKLFIELHSHLPPEMVYERELLICSL